MNVRSDGHRSFFRDLLSRSLSFHRRSKMYSQPPIGSYRIADTCAITTTNTVMLSITITLNNTM